MATIEMEAFSESQLVVLTLLMFAGGEIFTSMLGLQLNKVTKPKTKDDTSNDKENQIELGLVMRSSSSSSATNTTTPISDNFDYHDDDLECKSTRCLGYVLLVYLLAVHLLGSTSVAMYMVLFSSAGAVVKNKGIRIHTFSIFTVVSSFTNCGFIPVNEGMMAFKNNSGLLLLVVQLILAGNTLFPPCLRLIMWVLKKLTRRVEFEYMLENNGNHQELLLSGRRCVYLVFTSLGFVVVQLVVFCCMEWESQGLDGMSPCQKIVGALFQSVNSRHAGESTVDLSAVSPAILVLYMVMMYLPSYTTFMPLAAKDEEEGFMEKKEKAEKNLVFSQLTYLIIFTILICITERRKLSEDPLNFNVLNIAFEVISAYGNVGFSTCYSCQRRPKPGPECRDAWYGFVGRWSSRGKLILILVMFFGKLKKFSRGGGSAWRLD